jgi:hypothetical protein
LHRPYRRPASPGGFMIQSIEAIIERDGSILLGEIIKLEKPHRAIVTILEEALVEEVSLHRQGGVSHQCHGHFQGHDASRTGAVCLQACQAGDMFVRKAPASTRGRQVQQKQWLGTRRGPCRALPGHARRSRGSPKIVRERQLVA